jgi:hypothetical protein
VTIFSVLVKSDVVITCTFSKRERAGKILMATLLPPPKRPKVYHGIPEPEKVSLEQSPNVIVQFVSEDDGSALAPAVSLPANISRDDLQSLVNRLTSKVCC